MDSLGSRDNVLRFGSFEFEVRNGVLRKAGKSLRLQPQPAKILAMLLSRRGEVVTRDELQQEIWGKSTFVDFEHNLNFSVRQIRAALHDNADRPRFIETLSRRGYRFIGAVIEATPQTIKSLAVLPLENLSRNAEEEYFADGITDELITELAKIGALRVISRTSVQQYKRTCQLLPEIARKLNVDAVVEGTVSRWGGRVRIRAQLIDARREAHLWAESYERDLGDIGKLQAEIAQTIANQIHVRLTSEDESRLKSARRLDPAAHESYLRGRYFWNRRTEESLKRAEKYFEEAIHKDPTYALAYSGLADTYFYRGYIFGLMEPKDAMPKAKAAAVKALELDGTLAEAHVSLALVQLFFEWDWSGADREFKTALKLNPSYPTLHHAYSIFLAARGGLPQAMQEVKHALEIDPLSIPINNIVGELYMFAGEWDQAIEQYRQTIEMDPNVWIVHENLGIALEETGKNGEAVEEYLKARALSGASAKALMDLRDAYDRSGLRGFRQRQLEMDLERWNGWHSDAFHIAANYARLGEIDPALTWLERACEARSGWMICIQLYSYFKNLYAHPRFQHVVRRVGLPQ
jgi:TolB-like protein/Tfp pilus assembly protein PilF